jgi:RNA polymerase sigma-70 factor (ECF subfamily)
MNQAPLFSRGFICGLVRIWSISAMTVDRSEDESKERTAVQFATTHWSAIFAAVNSESSEAAAALENLCGQYWYPLYAFARRQGHSAEDAEDLVQSFLADFLERKALQAADPARGRFRSFLLICFKRYATNEWRRGQTAARGGGKSLFSLDAFTPEELYAREVRSPLSPDQLYDRAWACGILDRTAQALREDYARRDQSERFELLEPFLPGASRELSYGEVARRLGLSEVSVRAEVHRLKQRYRRLLRAQIAPTVSDADEIDQELKSLMAALAEEGAA